MVLIRLHPQQDEHCPPTDPKLGHKQFVALFHLVQLGNHAVARVELEIQGQGRFLIHGFHESAHPGGHGLVVICNRTFHQSGGHTHLLHLAAQFFFRPCSQVLCIFLAQNSGRIIRLFDFQLRFRQPSGFSSKRPK